MPDDSLELGSGSDPSRRIELGGDDPILDAPLGSSFGDEANAPSVDDFHLDGSDGLDLDEPVYSGFGATEEGTRVWPWLLAVAILVIGGVGYWWWTGRGPSGASAPDPRQASSAASERPEAVAPESDSPLEVAPAVTAELPELTDSDSFVRSLVQTVSAHPQLVEWLASDELVRRFTLVISNAAYDEAPAVHVPFLRPRGSFLVVGQGDTARIDPRSYARYDLLAQVVGSLDAAGSVEAYRRLRPLVEEVYAELGYPDSFSTALDRALAQVESVPSIPAEVDVRAKVMSYEFADPDLEQLSDFQKQLLRMGPDNLRIVKAKVREIRSRLAS